jgi:hypothetical protein
MLKIKYLLNISSPLSVGLHLHQAVTDAAVTDAPFDQISSRISLSFAKATHYSQGMDALMEKCV